MALETGTYVSDLVATNPLSSDLRSQGDDHLRLLKAVLQATFPNASKPFYLPGGLAKTTNYAILAANQGSIITGDATGGAFNLTLPTLASGDAGWRVHCVKIDTSANAVTVVGTIEGVANYALTAQYSGQTFYWTGTTWNLVSDRDFITRLVALTGPAVGDLLTINDISGGGNKKITLSDLLLIVNALTADASPDSAADYLLSYDTSAAAAKKILLANLPVVLPRGCIDGCILANNASDATNDIDIAAGVCRDSTNTVNITIAASTKQLDANWAAGTTGGGRNSAVGIANGTYHIFAVATAAGVSGIYFHTSTTVATVITALQLESGGSSYVYARRIGSILRESGVIVPFKQQGDVFYRITRVKTIAGSNDGTNVVTRTLAVPLGIVVEALIDFSITRGSNGAVDNYSLLTAATETNSVPSASIYSLHIAATQIDTQVIGGAYRVFTNTSGQVRTRRSSSGANSLDVIFDRGWVDTREKDA